MLAFFLYRKHVDFLDLLHRLSFHRNQNSAFGLRQLISMKAMLANLQKSADCLLV